MSDRLRVLPQYLLPKQALTSLMGALARGEHGAVTTGAIRRFVARYGVDMDEAAEPDIATYKSFNEFFTRPLKPGARPLADAPLICPVDGAISQLGAIEGDQIFQAKGHRYTTTALVGGDAALAAPFQGGHFATLYLSPKDYHRIHMPCEGRLRRMVHVPGALFSVNPTTARGVPGLFARNERVVCIFERPRGRTASSPPPEGVPKTWGGPAFPDERPGGDLFALVLVGATIVGSMATVWHGVVNPPRPGHLREWRYEGDEAVTLRQGEEMGRFLLGSTVVLLFPPRAPGEPPLRFNPVWSPGRSIRLGEAMAA
jgi:phosphatidylserine decarboxylase